MPTLGTKKKDSQSRLDRSPANMPQLSNEMQLWIMNKVKSGELTIEEAVSRAQKSPEDQEQKPTQYNFSVHKSSRYRWQKRVLQIDFKTKLLCSIEKGIVKRQLPFATVKSCDDGVGARFSISFKGHHDYELEATSLQDKHKMMQLVNQIIYDNIYEDPAGGDTESPQHPRAPESLREGVLMLHRGGLASFKWVKYKVQLHPGQLTLVRARSETMTSSSSSVVASAPIVVHLSHGDTSVQTFQSPDTFTLTTHKNEYQFRVAVPDQPAPAAWVQEERDSWVRAIHKLCSDWKRKSLGENAFLGTKSLRRHVSIPEDPEGPEGPEDGGAGAPAPSRTLSWSNTAPDDEKVAEGAPGGEEPESYYARPPPSPRPQIQRSASGIYDVLPPTPTSPPTSPTPPTSPRPTPTPRVRSILPRSPGPSDSASSDAAPQTPVQSWPPAEVKAPSAPFIPAAPPLPTKFLKKKKKARTKAFHWDLVAPDKITKSFWAQERDSSKKVDIDASRLLEQFAVKDLVSFMAAEPSNVQHIMLNEKIAHNFNIFLKSFPVRPAELKDKLFIIREEDGGLSDEHINSLRRYVPTLEDVEMYKSHKGPVTELHIVDQYMMEMCNISYLSTQLDLLLTLRELPVSVRDLQPLMNQTIRMCTQLSLCRSFVSVLQYVLAIGNFLNENSGKGKAKGFRLSSLTNLSQLRGSDRKFTLLDALVEQIMLHEPHLASFTEELAEFETVPAASIKGLTAEVDVLKNELQKVVQYRKMAKKKSAGGAHEKFKEQLKTVISKHDADLAALTKTCEEMKKLYSVILVKFGEPSDQDSLELFGLICSFIQDFRRAQTQTG